MTRELTDRQRGWAEAYVGPARYNASEAARMTGLSEAEGRRYRTKAHIVDYVEQLQASAIKSRLISMDRTLEEIISIALSDITEIVTIDDGRLIVRSLDELPRSVRCCIRSIKLRRSKRPTGEDEEGKDEFEEVFELTLHDKIKALEMLGRYQKMFSDNAGDGEERPAFVGFEMIAPPK
jgi:phage terminase small subunit